MNQRETPTPPRLAEWLLERLLSPYYGAIVGDFAEEYQDNVAAYGARTATLLYWKELLRALPSYTLNLLSWTMVMLANYLKVTLRTLARYKGFSAINILGLAVSMAVCLVPRLAMSEALRHEPTGDPYTPTPCRMAAGAALAPLLWGHRRRLRGRVSG